MTVKDRQTRQPRAEATLVTSYRHAPTRTVSAGGVELRLPRARPEDRRPGGLPHPPGRGPGQLGPAGRRRHRRAAPGHHLRQPRRRRLERHDARTPSRRWRTTPSPSSGRSGLEQVDLLGFSMGGMIAQVIARGRTAARPQADPRRHRARRRRGHHEGDPALAPRHRPRRCSPCRTRSSSCSSPGPPTGAEPARSSWPG